MGALVQLTPVTLENRVDGPATPKAENTRRGQLLLPGDQVSMILNQVLSVSHGALWFPIWGLYHPPHV